jgi:hypothetical protein
MQPWLDFSDGLWIPGDPDQAAPQPGFALPANALLKADNLEYLPSGGVRGRRGRVRRSIEIFDGQQFVGMHRHYPRQGSIKLGPVGSFTATDYVQSGSAITWANTATFSVSQPVSSTLNTGQISRILRVRDFGFALPANAVVTGIQVDVIRSATGTITDSSMRLFYLLDALTDEDRARAGIWNAAATQVSYGGPGDTWGLVWDPDDINTAFGCGLVVTAGGNGSVATVSAVAITVYYLAPVQPPVTLVAMNVDVFGAPLLQHVQLTPLGTWQTFPGYRPYRAARRVRFVPWPEQDATFLFDGLNPVRRYDSPSPSTLPFGQMSLVEAAVGGMAPPPGPYAALWQSRLWATTPSEINFSVYGSEVNDPTTWRGDIQLSVNDPDGGIITGLVPVAGNVPQLIILKDTCLFYFIGDPLSGGQLVRYSQRGCIAPDTVQLSPWGVIFLGSDALYLTDGQTENLRTLSDPFRPLFRGRTSTVRYPDAVGIYYPNARQYWLKLDPADADGYVLHFLGEGASPKVAWSHMPVMPLQAACVWGGGQDNGELLVGGADGYVRLADSGSVDDDGTVEGQLIPVLVRTGARVMDDRTPVLREGRINYVKPSLRSAAAITAALRYDSDDSRVLAFNVAEAGTLGFHNLRATITDQETFGRVVDVQILNASDGPDFELHRVALDATFRTVRQWR